MTEPLVRPDRPDAHELGRTQIRGSTLLLIGRVASMGLTIATQVLLVRALSKTEFGAFAFALAITSACRILLSVGQGRTLSRFLAIYEERRQYDRLFGALILVVLTIVVTSAALLTAFWLGRDALAGVIDAPGATDILVILLLLAPLEALDEAFGALFAVFARPMSIFMRRYVLTPGLRFLVVVVLFVMDSSAIFLAVGYVVTSFLGLLLYITLGASLLRERGLLAHLRRERTVRLPVRDVFSFSVPSLSTDLLYLSMQTGSVFILASWWGATEVADYRAVFPAGRLNQFIYMSFALMYLPTVARLFAREDRSALRETYWRTAVFMAVFSFPVFAMTVPFARATTVALFGDRYAAAALVLAVLSLGYYANAALGFNWQTLQTVGKVRYILVVNLSCAVLNVALVLALVPHAAAVGVAAANCAVLVVQNIVNQIGVARVMGGSLIERGFRRPYVVIGVVGTALTGLGVWLDPALPAAIAMAVPASAVVLLLCRHQLHLGETFPEIRRLPVLGRFIG